MSFWERGVVASVFAVLLGSVLTACSDTGPVPVDSPSLAAPAERACRAFLDAAPATLAGQERRETSPAGAPGAAWGDPAIVVTCGGPLPTAYDRFAECTEADGVGWFVPDAQREDQSSDIVWTAVGYRPLVSIHLPADYRPEGAAAVITQLAGPVRQSLRLVRPCH